MMHEKEISDLLLTTLKIVRQNLIFRIKVIDSVGTRGQADDIRKLTREIHSAAITRMDEWTPSKEWNQKTILDKYNCFYALVEYVANMERMESNALEMLETVKSNMPEESRVLLDEALEMHKITLAQTLGLQQTMNWMRKYIGHELDKHMVSLIDSQLSEQRNKLIMNLQSNINPPTPKL